MYKRQRLTFADSAPGVSDDQLQKLFERFYRTEGSRNRASGGSGLGLAICPVSYTHLDVYKRQGGDETATGRAARYSRSRLYGAVDESVTGGGVPALSLIHI